MKRKAGHQTPHDHLQFQHWIIIKVVCLLSLEAAHIRMKTPGSYSSLK